MTKGWICLALVAFVPMLIDDADGSLLIANAINETNDESMNGVFMRRSESRSDYNQEISHELERRGGKEKKQKKGKDGGGKEKKEKKGKDGGRCSVDKGKHDYKGTCKDWGNDYSQNKCEICGYDRRRGKKKGKITKFYWRYSSIGRKDHCDPDSTCPDGEYPVTNKITFNGDDFIDVNADDPNSYELTSDSTSSKLCMTYLDKNGNTQNCIVAHTSCSQPIAVGNQYGPLTLIKVEFEGNECDKNRYTWTEPDCDCDKCPCPDDTPSKNNNDEGGDLINGNNGNGEGNGDLINGNNGNGEENGDLINGNNGNGNNGNGNNWNGNNGNNGNGNNGNGNNGNGEENGDLTDGKEDVATGGSIFCRLSPTLCDDSVEDTTDSDDYDEDDGTLGNPNSREDGDDYDEDDGTLGKPNSGEDGCKTECGKDLLDSSTWASTLVSDGSRSRGAEQLWCSIGTSTMAVTAYLFH